MKKTKTDWKGEFSGVLRCNGARSEKTGEREANDFYATDPRAVQLLLEKEQFSRNAWEPACGKGHISKALEKHGYIVKSTDLIQREYGIGGVDFFKQSERWDGDIITNPPYILGKEFVEHSLDLVLEGRKVAMFLKLTFLEGKERRKLFTKYPPKYVYVATSRFNCVKNGDFERYANTTSAVYYTWFVWEKGYGGEPTLRWFNDAEAPFSRAKQLELEF